MWTEPWRELPSLASGRMGQGMVGRYLDAGFELAVFERMDGDKPEIR
jgi:3-hydroxyisobutyrate dehydrogenase-like beta-hydroxyacid dehydrogenase